MFRDINIGEELDCEKESPCVADMRMITVPHEDFDAPSLRFDANDDMKRYSIVEISNWLRYNVSLSERSRYGFYATYHRIYEEANGGEG